MGRRIAGPRPIARRRANFNKTRRGRPPVTARLFRASLDLIVVLGRNGEAASNGPIVRPDRMSRAIAAGPFLALRDDIGGMWCGLLRLFGFLESFEGFGGCIGLVAGVFFNYLARGNVDRIMVFDYII